MLRSELNNSPFYIFNYQFVMLPLPSKILDIGIQWGYNTECMRISKRLFERKIYMSKPVMMTAEGYKQLEEELDYLLGEKRKEVAEKIKVARSYGDLSENSEYDDAKNEQAILEARISTIEATLKNAVIIDESGITNEHVHVGSKVKLEHLTAGRVLEYKIVGSKESKPSEGRISDESPVGMALIGHAVGDVVEVETPTGVIAFKVLEISR